MLLSEKYIIFNKYPNKALPLTDFLFSMSLPMISTSSASKRDCCVHQSGSSENTRNLMLLYLLRKCSIAFWRVFTCQVSTVLNYQRISFTCGKATCDERRRSTSCFFPGTSLSHRSKNKGNKKGGAVEVTILGRRFAKQQPVSKSC